MPDVATNSAYLNTKSRLSQKGVLTPVFVQANNAAFETATVATAEAVIIRPLIDPVDLSVHVGDIKLFKPELSVLLSNVTPATEGTERSQLSVPLSATEEITDEQFFEDPADSAKKYYLPRYRVLEITTTTGKQFDISMKQSSAGGTLEIKLEKYPAASIETAAASAQEITHFASVLLQFDISMQGGVSMQKELPFTEITREAYGIHAVLPVNGLTQFTQIYQALTESSYNSRLIVRRLVTVALPVSVSLPQNTGIFFNPDAKLRPVVRPSPAVLVATFTDVTVAPAPETKLYHQTSRSLDVTIPFTFPVALHGYIFKDITASGSPSGPGLQQHQVGLHRYYQDMVQPGVFYYLPDSFKIARRPAPSFAPFICVSISGDGSMDETDVTIEYVAVPYTDSKRVKEAEPQLKQSLNAGQEIQFMPLIAHATFNLALPGTGGGLAGPFQERAGAMVELREGVHDSVTLSLKNFQILYDALMGASQTLFTGQVIVSITERDKIQIPFSARMNDLAGDVFTIRQQYDTVAGKGSIVIRNEIESPLSIQAIQITLSDGAVPVPFNSEGADLSAMLNILPQQETKIGIVPMDASFVTKPLEINTVLSDVETQPDKEAIWNAILNPYTPVEYERTIVVETFDELFSADPQAGTDTSVKAILIIFFNGNSVTLRPTALKATAIVNVSLSNYILGKVDTREYKYQVEVVTITGKRKIGAPGEWITDQADELFITKNLIT